ncbi:hypothetical protein M1N42_03270 [Thermodesulfovibrionales bacterium]|nr:hypothetical protein [Thermodesulfovibrionales bacterium]
MLHGFPDDKMLLEEIVDLCVISLENPKLGRPWLNRLAKLRSLWLDYTLLSSAEAELENFTKAREYLQIARRLQKEQSWAISPKKNPKRVFTEREDFIKHREWNVLAKKQGGSSELGVKGEKQQMQIKKSEDRKLRKQKDKNSSLVTHQPPSAKKRICISRHIPSL